MFLDFILKVVIAYTNQCSKEISDFQCRGWDLSKPNLVGKRVDLN